MNNLLVFRVKSGFIDLKRLAHGLIAKRKNALPKRSQRIHLKHYARNGRFQNVSAKAAARVNKMS